MPCMLSTAQSGKRKGIQYWKNGRKVAFIMHQNTHLLCIRTLFKGYLIQSPRAQGKIGVTAPFYRWGCWGSHIQGRVRIRIQIFNTNSDTLSSSRATLSLQGVQGVNRSSRSRDPPDPGVPADGHVMETCLYLVQTQGYCVPCEDCKQDKAVKFITIPNRWTSGNCEINTQSFWWVGDGAGRNGDESSEGSVISWSVSSDLGCPTRDVASPSVEDKHKQLCDHS